jgi:hypothetical protein
MSNHTPCAMMKLMVMTVMLKRQMACNDMLKTVHENSNDICFCAE